MQELITNANHWENGIELRLLNEAHIKVSNMLIPSFSDRVNLLEHKAVLFFELQQLQIHLPLPLAT